MKLTKEFEKNFLLLSFLISLELKLVPYNQLNQVGREDYYDN